MYVGDTIAMVWSFSLVCKDIKVPIAKYRNPIMYFMKRNENFQSKKEERNEEI